jgi:hypothetical protein
MLLTLAMLFVLLWLFGAVASYTFGGFLHVLIAVAVALLVVRAFKRQGRRGHGHRAGG